MRSLVRTLADGIHGGTRVALLVMSLASCGGDAQRTPPSSVGDVGGGQSGGEGEGSEPPPDPSDIAKEGEAARSFVQLGRLGPASMMSPLLHMHEEGRDGAPPSIKLFYAADFSAELYLRVELPYTGEPVLLSLPYEAAMWMTEQVAGTLVERVAIGGSIAVTPSADGVTLALSDIVMRVSPGEVEEPFGDGAITGEVERRCVVLTIDPMAPTQDGKPIPQPTLDESWSSPFCAQYR